MFPERLTSGGSCIRVWLALLRRYVLRQGQGDEEGLLSEQLRGFGEQKWQS
jgi:hypothetical protein